MSFSTEILALIEGIASRHTDDIEAATTQAIAVLQQRPEYEALVADLVRHAVRDLVGQTRHRANVQLKRDAGYYGAPPKVEATTPAMQAVYRSIYDYYIAGTTLGELRGRELMALATKERATADGHLFNATLLESLARVVPNDDTRVRDAVPERNLRGMFQRTRRRTEAA